jgi:uncharacterized repeat protein (TIGR01451 family)
MKKFFLLTTYLFFAISSFAQSFIWGGSHGSNYGNSDSRSHISNEGYIYTYGRIFPNQTYDVDLSPNINTVTTQSQYSSLAIICKYDLDGNLIWHKTIGADTSFQLYNFNTHIYNVVTDKDNNLYVRGMFKGAVDFDPDSTNTHIDTTAYVNNQYKSEHFLLKLDQNGSFVWQHSYHHKLSTYGPNLTISDSAVYLDFSLGFQSFYTDSFDFDFSNNTDYYKPEFGVWVMQKVDFDGNHQWIRQLDIPITTYFFAHHEIKLQTDDANNIYIIGDTKDTLHVYNWNGNSYHIPISGDSTNAFIIKADPSGNFNDVRMFEAVSSYSSSNPTDIYCKNGKIVITGEYFGSVDFDLGTGSSVSTTIIDTSNFILYIDTALNYLHHLTFGTNDDLKPLEILLDNNNNCYISGQYNTNTDLDPTQGVHLGSIDNDPSTGHLFFTKIDSNNLFDWSITFTKKWAYKSCYRSYMQLDSASNLYLSDFIMTNVDYDIGANNLYFNSTTQGTSFLLKYNPNSSCYSFNAGIDSTSDINCSTLNGYVSSTLYGGSPPYTFIWNTGDTSTFISPSTPGFYQVEVTDSNNCSRTTAAIISGPTTQSGYDLQVNMLTNGFQTGFSHIIWLDAFNEGCTPISGQYGIVLDTLVTLDSASISPDYIFGDTLIWDFSNLIYGTHLQPILYVTTSTSALFGGTACFSTFITPDVADLDSSNNYKDYCFPIVNAYDPNYKAIHPAGPCAVNYALDTEVLTYTVHFQNTGNATAYNIYVLDELSPDLDVSTVNVLAQSHPDLQVEVLSNNTLKFRFDNIMLPDSTSDEENSHGYFVFEVNTLPGLPYGTQIDNGVGIYFDFNPPVLTNIVSTIIVDSIPSPAPINPWVVNSAVCEGDSTQAYIQPNFSNINWLDGFSNNSLLPTQSDWYSVSALDSNGCFTLDSIFLTVNSNPSIHAMITDSIICEGDTAIAYINQSFDQMLWSSGSNTDSSLAQTSGWQTVWVMDGNGCMATDSVYLHSNPLPNTPIISQIGDSIFVPNDSNLSYQWYNGGGVVVINETGFWLTPSVEGDYSIAVTDSNGCTEWSDLYTFSFINLGEELAQKASIYPNPFKDFTTLSFAEAQTNTLVELRDIHGKILQTYTVNGKSLEIQRDELPVGLYFLQIGHELNKVIAY